MLCLNELHEADDTCTRSVKSSNPLGRATLRQSATRRPYDVAPRFTIEAGYHLAHVSNGLGLVPQNPMWNGQGGFLSLRRRFGP
jgi:hypothetical protein